jgi:3-hydroxy-9,10-secoandrosta-1,3,5(10)-triene-9,17-dione monooxygenase reductase component
MANQLTSGPDPAEWRAAMGYFPTGVTVVTSWRQGAPIGSTINAICSVSLDPPLLLICLDLANPLCDPVADCSLFGVNFLGEDGRDLALRFGVAPDTARFAGLAYGATDGGAPQLDAAAVFVDCAVESISQAGDHLLVVGRGVRTSHGRAAAPLLYHRGGFPKLHVSD